jgi:superfamily I DNA/RNA helicase
MGKRLDALALMLLEEIVLAARTNALLHLPAARLHSAVIACPKIAARTLCGVGVQLETMHRVKGLEFRVAFLVRCSVDEALQPYTSTGTTPPGPGVRNVSGGCPLWL